MGKLNCGILQLFVENLFSKIYNILICLPIVYIFLIYNAFGETSRKFVVTI